MSPVGEFAPGVRIGHLTVLYRTDNSVLDKARWLCRCVCGKELIIIGTSLRRATGRRSCGCQRPAPPGPRSTRHTPTYTAWAAARSRCKQTAAFGERTILVMCEAWASFDTFLRDMGPRPSGAYALTRTPDPHGPFSPANCQWAPTAERYSTATAKALVVAGLRHGVPLDRLLDNLIEAVRRRVRTTASTDASHVPIGRSSSCDGRLGQLDQKRSRDRRKSLHCWRRTTAPPLPAVE